MKNYSSLSDPPLHEMYKTLFQKDNVSLLSIPFAVEECELPLIDLSRLNGHEEERRDCKSEIAKASREWGFFQAVNHGISREILDEMKREQVRVFEQPFEKKAKEAEFLKFSAGSYQWGTPSATCLRQLSWSEAFHVPLMDICSGSKGRDNLRYTKYSPSNLFPILNFFFFFIAILS